MATASADPLRSTLDNLELDPRSEADRPYLVAMLRRLGYTERDIEEVIRTGKMPTTEPVPADALAPARDYRLVVPARDTAFAVDTAGEPGRDAPFEDLERLEFEDPNQDVEFEDVTGKEAATGAAGEPAWETTEEGAWQEAPIEDMPLEETRRGDAFDTTQFDTFGDPNAPMAAPKTRVRVRRVRAGSKEEAERKVAREGRNVIKSVPVDIVERWGAAPRDQDDKGA